jgi:hypothetical protein
MLDFVTATQQRDAINAELSRATDALRLLTNALAGDAPRPMGLTPDSVKADPRWQVAKHSVDWWFRALRNFNGTYTKQFKSELAAQRRAA